MKKFTKTKILCLLAIIAAIVLTVVVVIIAFLDVPVDSFLGTSARGLPINAFSAIILSVFCLWFVPILLWQYFRERKMTTARKSPKKKIKRSSDINQGNLQMW